MWYEKLLQNGWVPEFLLRIAIRRKIAGRIKADPQGTAMVEYQNSLYNQLNRSPIAIHTDSANEQHYELSVEFFEIILGPRLKYSSCLFTNLIADPDLLPAAEEQMLELTIQRAGIDAGDTVLELGCGWGSLTLYMAEQYNNLSITAISNSDLQREYIEEQVRVRKLDNVEVITANIAEFNFSENKQFDVIVSVEMFEHMRNYTGLLRKIYSWLKPGGNLFARAIFFIVCAELFGYKQGKEWVVMHYLFSKD